MNEWGNDNSGVAFWLAELGYYVFPVRLDKRPLTRNGFKDASSDLKQVYDWWETYPGALVGIACGPSGFFALDIDVKDGRDGFASLDRLQSGRRLDFGPMQRTPHGGTHALFRQPEGVIIPTNSDRLGPGLDLRGPGGYIVTGEGYTWLPRHGPDTALPDAPDWLLRAIQATQKAVEQPAPVGCQAPGGNLAERLLARYLGYAHPGNRNRACFGFGQQLFFAGVPLAEAENLGRRFARECPPGEHLFGEDEALVAIRSAYKSTVRRPPFVFHTGRA